ncbi:MAG: carbohydrate ABC transporter permease [Lachnospiraceae bacterium]|jgi:ABC-type glycerol-3-phosphate transport system permease component|nr:carbohydrate ABC transporter permease [Lachnospiraceae bacterium]
MKKRKQRRGDFQGARINPRNFSTGQIKFYAVLIPLALFMILPVVMLVNRAFMPLGELFAFPPHIIARNPTMSNFKSLFALSGTTGVPMLRYLLNSVLVTVMTVALNLVITILGAYVFAKKNFKGKGALFEINQLALMFVPTAVAISRYLVITRLQLTDTWLVHVLPLAAMPVGLFLVKQFTDQIPDALIEAAVMDGAKELTVVRKIIVPLIRPALATSIVLTFQQVWMATEASNNYVNNDTMRTLAYYLNSLSTNNAIAAAGMTAAASVLLFLPNLIIFICMQSQVMNTMSHSGIK